VWLRHELLLVVLLQVALPQSLRLQQRLQQGLRLCGCRPKLCGA
jgi:hypothetical protein